MGTVAVERSGVVIVGGGFAGVELAIRLTRSPGRSITVISNRPDLVYKPWLIFVPASRKRLQDTAIPIQPLAARHGFRFVKGSVRSIDLRTKTVAVEGGEPFEYEALVIATGAAGDRARLKGAAEHALFPCEPDDAERMRALIQERQPSRIAVVVGWDRPGPGLEFAGWLGARRRQLGPRSVEVVAIDGDRSLRAHFGGAAIEEIRSTLAGRGVRLDIDVAVNEVAVAGPVVDGTLLEAGMTAVVSPLCGVDLGLPGSMLDAWGFVRVNSCFVTAHEDVFAFGDAAAPPAEMSIVRAMMTIHERADAMAANVAARLDGSGLAPLQPASASRTVMPNLGGRTVVMRDQAVVAKGRLPLLNRYLFDRRYFQQRS